MSRISSLSFLTILVAVAAASPAQEPAPQERVAALKQSIQESQAKIRHYEWIETTVISLKGEEKARTQKKCYYGADGKVQKTAIEQPAQQADEGRRGGRRNKRLKKKIVEKKKAEMTAEMKRATELLHMYVPPDPARLQRAKDAGKASMEMVEPGSRARLSFRDYLQDGDTLAIDLDPTANALLAASVKTHLDDAGDAVGLDVSFASLPDGASYPSSIDLTIASQKLHVKVEQSGHRKVAQ